MAEEEVTGDRTETAKDASGGVKASEREEKKEGGGERSGGGGVVGWGRWLGGGSGEGRSTGMWSFHEKSNSRFGCWHSSPEIGIGIDNP